jgi:hypothetical protein
MRKLAHYPKSPAWGRCRPGYGHPRNVTERDRGLVIGGAFYVAGGSGAGGGSVTTSTGLCGTGRK